MMPTAEEIQKVLAENEQAIIRAKFAEERFRKSVKRHDRHIEELRERLRRAGLLPDSA